MRYLSVCSGIEAASVAWPFWTPVGFSEIEKFPCALLKHHYPSVPNYGNLLNHADWPDLQPDLVVGGTPCQAFSIAGLRAGLADPRGNLTLVFLGLVARQKPEWVVWENVPGVLSDKTGAFASFVGGLDQLGYGVAWRVLDAQYFGVPQRRRRVFVVGRLGDIRGSAQVLFEPESLRGNPAESGAERENAAARAGGGAAVWPAVAHSLRADGFDASEDGTGRGTPLTVWPDVAMAVMARDAKGPRNYQDGGLQNAVAFCDTCDGGYAHTAHTLRVSAPNTHVVAFNDVGRAAYATTATTIRTGGGEGHSTLVPVNLRYGVASVASTLRSEREATAVVFPTVDANIDRKWGSDQWVGSKAYALQETASRENPDSGPRGKGWKEEEEEEEAFTLDTRPQNVATNWRVRRITPRECERLQGFPDDYTQLGNTPDGPRYKALGNSMAVPVMRWIGERIQRA